MPSSVAVWRSGFDELGAIMQRCLLQFFAELEQFHFERAKAILSRPPHAPRQKLAYIQSIPSWMVKVAARANAQGNVGWMKLTRQAFWTSMLSPLLNFAECEHIYYSMSYLASPSDTFTAMYVQVVEEMQTLLDLLQMDSPEEAQAPVAMELAISARSFAALAQEICVLVQTRGMAINYDEFANALKALTKRPVRGKHALLRRIRTNTLSEIEVICRLMKCQA
eukprot:g4166.t1